MYLEHTVLQGKALQYGTNEGSHPSLASPGGLGLVPPGRPGLALASPPRLACPLLPPLPSLATLPCLVASLPTALPSSLPAPPGPGAPCRLNHLCSSLGLLFAHLLHLAVTGARGLGGAGLGEGDEGRVQAQLQLGVILQAPGQLLGVVHECSDLCEVIAAVGDVRAGAFLSAGPIHSILLIRLLLLLPPAPPPLVVPLVLLTILGHPAVGASPLSLGFCFGHQGEHNQGNEEEQNYTHRVLST